MLRLIWQELKFRRHAILGWGLGLCFFPIVYIGIYPSVADQMQGFADLELYKAMGMSIGTFISNRPSSSSPASVPVPLPMA